MSAAAEVVAEMDILRHMLGVGSHIPQRDWCYRNYFNGGPGHSDMPTISRLVSKGLVESYRTDYWRATEAGMRAIGLNQRQIKKAQEP